jgi:hypothetical protein
MFPEIVACGSEPPVIMVVMPASNSQRSSCPRSQARNSSSDIDLTAAPVMRGMIQGPASLPKPNANALTN